MTPDPDRPQPRRAERPFWWTGTPLDQFIEIEMHFQQRTRLHGLISPPELAKMDLATVASLMGVGLLEHEQRIAYAGAQGAPDVAMVPKSQQTASTGAVADSPV